MLKTIFNIGLFTLLGWLFPIGAQASDGELLRQTQQVAALVDYIAADYPAAVKDGRVKKGDLVLLEAMGGGFTWGSALLRW